MHIVVIIFSLIKIRDRAILSYYLLLSSTATSYIIYSLKYLKENSVIVKNLCKTINKLYKSISE